MFRKKISNDEKEESKNPKNISNFAIKKRVEEKREIIIKENRDKDLTQEELIDFFVTIFGDKSLKDIREKNYIVLREADSKSSNREWIKSFIDDYFDIEVQRELKRRISDYLKLKSTTQLLEEELNRVKNENYRLQKRLNEVVEIKELIDRALNEEYDYQEIKKLLKSSLKEEIEEGAKFITPFLLSLQKIIALKEISFHSEEEKRDIYIKMVNSLLKSISNCYISQRKDILRELASIISEEFKEIKFISPEDYRFVEPKIHNIPENRGEKVLEAKSFAVINRKTEATIIYADIEAE